MRDRKRRFSREDWVPFESLNGIVRIVLCVCWDPIGVFGQAETLDEYDSYVADVCDLLRNGATPEELRSHLIQVEVERMGIRRESTPDMNLAIEKLLKASEFGDTSK